MVRAIVKKEWFKWILFGILVLVLMDILTNILTSSSIIIKLFNITVEKNIPTLVSTVQLMFGGSLLYITYKTEKESSLDLTCTSYWKYLAFVFYFLAFDEWVTFHDVFGHSIAKHMGALGDIFSWTLIYIVIMPIFFIWTIRFLVKLDRPTAVLYVLSGAIFLTGAIGLELMQSSKVQSLLGISFDISGNYILGIFEESFELLGIFIFNFATFLYIRSNFKNKPIYINCKVYGIIIGGCILDIIGTFYYQFK